MNALKSWGLMRVLRLVFGALAIIKAIVALDIILGLFGSVLLGMALLNKGYCVANSCNANYKNSSSKKGITDVEYEEVVTK